MAEAIAAFSLAATIVQFVTFGSSIVATLWSIYRSGRGTSDAVLNVQETIRSLETVLTNVKSPLPTDKHALSDSEQSLASLKERCQEIATEILDGMRRLQLPEKAGKRNALKVAIRSAWEEDEIQANQLTLEALKHDLTLYLLAALREQAGKSLSQQELVLKQLSAVQDGTKDIQNRVHKVTAEGIGASLLDFLTSKIRSEEKRSWHQDFLTAIYKDTRPATRELATNFSISQERRLTLHSAFVARLRYAGMDDREDRIKAAYEKTFEWIFEDRNAHEQKWASFTSWLESDLQLYWITGKAGSGKSTLMKFVRYKESQLTSSHGSSAGHIAAGGTGKASKLPAGRCETHLNKWAAGRKLIIATYFFWNSGIPLQMSKKGLLRSLLFQILQNSPDIIPLVPPNRWEALCLFNDDPREWSQEELEKMLRSATENLVGEANIFFLIDGLDEFDGEHNDLIRLLQDLVTNSNVKICVSSRPWVLFEDAFEHKPSLMLQDLTDQDITHFVTSRLHDDPGFLRLRRSEQLYADQLVENIVSKAAGVFLWVHLVVSSLLAGMGHGDRVSDLQRRLDLLPPDLEKLYENILQSLDDFYLEHAAQLFMLIRESLEPPTMLLLSFADEEAQDFSLKQPTEKLDQEDLILRADTMRRRLNSRCKGLLEVRGRSAILEEIGMETVQYLHRTVKDYVEQTEVQDKLNAAMKSDFDPHLKLCSARLAHLKVLDPSTDVLDDGTFWSQVRGCLYSASRIRPTNRSFLVPLLDELDKTGQILVKRIMEKQSHLTWFETRGQRTKRTGELLAAGNWVLSHPLFNDLENQYAFGCNFLALAVRYNVVDYVRARANPRCLTLHPCRGPWPLIGDATYVSSEFQSELQDAVPSTKMIACLLEKGADPNHIIMSGISRCQGSDPIKPSTVWQRTIPHLLEAFDGSTIEPPWYEIARLMVTHGARVSKEDFAEHLPGRSYRKAPAKSRWPSAWTWGQNDPWPNVGPFMSGWKVVKVYDILMSMKRPPERSWSSWIQQNLTWQDNQPTLASPRMPSDA